MTNSILRIVWTETLLLCEIHLEHPLGKLVLFVGVEPSGYWIRIATTFWWRAAMRSCVEVSTKFRENSQYSKKGLIIYFVDKILMTALPSAFPAPAPAP